MSLRRIPSLDGLRTLSIFLVVALHTVQRFSLSHHVALPWYAFFNGGMGVSIFFVISGYLITGLLLKEHAARGTISLRWFFMKRAFRILPPILFYLLILTLLAAWHRVPPTRFDVVSALLFFRNYAPAATSWTLEHFWSLSVEEQFYLLWPPILLLCLRAGNRAGRRLAGRIAIAMLVVVPLLRGLSLFSHSPFIHNGSGFHAHADTLMFGCTAALLEGRTRFERLYRALTRWPWFPPLVLLGSSFLEMRFQNLWNFSIGRTLTGCFITASCFGAFVTPSPELAVSSTPPAVVHIGVLSYSIYLWQTLFLHHGNVQTFHPALWIGMPPVNWLAILLVAEVSYRFVEAPSLRMRNTLLRRSVPPASPAPSPGTRRSPTHHNTR